MVLLWVGDAFSKEEGKAGVGVPGQQQAVWAAGLRRVTKSFPQLYPISSPLWNKGHYGSQSVPQTVLRVQGDSTLYKVLHRWAVMVGEGGGGGDDCGVDIWIDL